MPSLLLTLLLLRRLRLSQPVFLPSPSPASYPKGATLYVEGQLPRGVFIICSGRVKLSTSSADGRTLILRMAESGDVLGIPASVTGKPYELTADVLEPTQANFIHRQDFRHPRIHRFQEKGVPASKGLGRDYQECAGLENLLAP